MLGVGLPDEREVLVVGELVVGELVVVGAGVVDVGDADVGAALVLGADASVTESPQPAAPVAAPAISIAMIVRLPLLGRSITRSPRRPLGQGAASA